MSVTVRTLNQTLNVKQFGPRVGDFAPVLDMLLQPSPLEMLALEVSAASLDALLDAIDALAGRLDDPDRIAAIRLNETAFCAELDAAERQVDPRRLQ